MDKKVRGTIKCVACDEKSHIYDAEYIYHGHSLCSEHFAELKDEESIQAGKNIGFQPAGEDQ